MIRTLVDAGVTTCFTNPGTSEMHFVAALDTVPAMRGVLGLFEGVVTGAADGYARMAERPAATLLHLGPGLGNGLANLHNARRAATPVVNVVGDHATYHARFDAPLHSDIDAAARNVSGWIGRPERTADLCRVTAEAVDGGHRPARPGGHADPAGGRVVGRRSGSGRARATPGPSAGRCGRRRCCGQGAAVRRAGRPAARWDVAAAWGAHRRGPRRRRHRRSALRRDVRRPHRARGRDPRGREAAVLR